MNFIHFIIRLLSNVYGSADPNLFGSIKRRHDKNKIADSFRSAASDTQKLIDQTLIQNPFESAGAKSAMTLASQRAKQFNQRLLNTMGANASTESMVAAQGNLGQNLGATAGQIAAGAEANKQNEIANLRNLKAGQEGTAAQIGIDAANERGSGWTSFFQSLESIGKLAEGIGGAVTAFKGLPT